MNQDQAIPHTDPADVEQLIARLKQSTLNLQDQDRIERLLRLVLQLVELLQYKNISIKRLRNMIFGPRTEKRKVSDRGRVKEKQGAAEDGEIEPEVKSESAPTNPADQGAMGAGQAGGKGHGRRATADFVGAKVLECRHESPPFCNYKK